ncbi:arylsulfatase B [Lepeophtheirus salmonis]|uniref:Arylsulfatase Jlike [Megachile rotundata] n=1 Tax=Lepeophtheirus salmonis TaxID=72036 RepID=A0A0K2UCD5_LEPSM|nr:arylsulfatase B-like [Lepeophtheirus salmonis]XP_040581443.1 arylsulfatase B-like [Lepeophtheirus salmonis]
MRQFQQVFLLWMSAISVGKGALVKRPHIIIIVADDLGWNDVGFHGSNQIPTPNIDALAYSGKILNNYYVNPICTPSRSALMTGLHPIHTGLQLHTIPAGAPYGLPLNLKILPEYLNELGYESHAIGKWHLGSFRKVYTPTYRGFKSHHGYWQGAGDYFGHTHSRKSEWGYDFYKNMDLDYKSFGNYSTKIFTSSAEEIINTHGSAKNENKSLFLYLAHQAVHSATGGDPLQAPSEDIKRFQYIEDQGRRIFAADLYNLDKSVGSVISALRKNDMLKDSIIIFTTDNGGPAAGFNENRASNWPLRGVKDTLWEGGVRGAGIFWSPEIALNKKKEMSMDLMSIQDWLPTLYTAAGGKKNALPMMDGFDLWPTLTQGTPSPRNVLLHNIDEERFASAIRIGPWKFVKGTTYHGAWDGWYGPSGRNITDYDILGVYKSESGKSLSLSGFPLPNKNDILSIRNTSSVSCLSSSSQVPCLATASVCLFNITHDPCEKNNLAFEYPSVVELAESALKTYRSTEIPPRNKAVDPRSAPRNWDYVWVNWMDYISPNKTDAKEDSGIVVNTFVHHDFFVQRNILRFIYKDGRLDRGDNQIKMR